MSDENTEKDYLAEICRLLETICFHLDRCATHLGELKERGDG